MVPAFLYSLYLTLYKTDISLKRTLRDQSLFIAEGGGGEDFWGDNLIFRRTKRGIRITENFGRIQRGGPLKSPSLFLSRKREKGQDFSTLHGNFPLT